MNSIQILTRFLIALWLLVGAGCSPRQQNSSEDQSESPRLLGVLVNEKLSENERRGALEALATANDWKSLARSLFILNDSEQNGSLLCEAIEAIGDVGDPAAIKELSKFQDSIYESKIVLEEGVGEEGALIYLVIEELKRKKKRKEEEEDE